MALSYSSPITLALFCKVVDNYGDIGICWRLARQLQHEHGVAVTLWVDDLRSFQRICPEVQCEADVQCIAGVTVRHWRDQAGTFAPAEIADIVIEFFACDIPPGYIEAMATRPIKPVWLNLEGLTAEEWVEGCHRLPSMHPRLPLTKHFFFPGFTAKTGGLLCEAGLHAQRQAFQADRATQQAFLQRLGLTPEQSAAFKISLFCYPHAPVRSLFALWQAATQAVTCLVPEGVAVEAVQAFLQQPPIAGASATHGALTVKVLPFVPQPDYDRLLWACDLNFVRGEDSFVRAQWAARPFVWHIYPQDENLHHVKLRAFLQRYASAFPSLAQFSLYWNGALEADPVACWTALQNQLPEIADQADRWQESMLANGDLSCNLLRFAADLRAEQGKKPV
ncbi:elongation factor P maturation arginine rhamnosyltransferase EarP [uncultured Oxalicibacterium sp.]|uniref:elongation factor P maturation arginine rhamnosyltransferase EarP n=1 Tax=uncultured Oxalicibacterium sp. TaxID=1168540 RepID=UPI0025EAF611|nr:elongation factor P maturation arginine rhamnosyltransferase EarP [uncultured Oxalicibacterium sp.]